MPSRFLTAKPHLKTWSMSAGELALVGTAVAMLAAGIIWRENFIRYAVYLVPLLMLGYGLTRPQAALLKKPSVLLLVAATALLLGVLISERLNALSYLLFTVFGLLPLAQRGGMSPVWLYALLGIVALYQFYLTATLGLGLTSFVNTEYAAETHAAPFIAGLLAGVFLILRRYWATALALAVVLLSGKRIVLVAAVVGFAFIYGERFLAGAKFLDRFRWMRGALQFATMLGLFILSLYLPQILRSMAYDYALDENIFSAGRIMGQSRAYEVFFNGSPAELFFGHGLGTADRFAEIAWARDGMLIHNDYLRLVLDLGVLGGLVFAVVYLRLIGRGIFGPYIAAFTLALWLTDNTLVYAFYGASVSLAILAGRNVIVNQRQSRSQGVLHNIAHRCHRARDGSRAARVSLRRAP